MHSRTTFVDFNLDFKHSRTTFVDFYLDFNLENRHSRTVPLRPTAQVPLSDARRRARWETASTQHDIANKFESLIGYSQHALVRKQERIKSGIDVQAHRSFRTCCCNLVM
jgi:hypothetical protein